jgi:drug/metabolite transporter (DMT)-like permease
MATRQNSTAILSLLTGATIWGLIWYPYRIIDHAGIGGVVASMSTYSVAFLLGLVVFRRELRGIRLSWWLPLIALASGGCNLGYVLAVLSGEVMRVLLLFYLSPLWTVLLSRLLLGEQLQPPGIAVISLSLCGAIVMLWHPELGMPWPQHEAEWIGLGAGFMFALNNVLIRRTGNLSIELKSMVSFLGVVVCGALLLPWVPFTPQGIMAMASGEHIFLILILGVVLLAVNLVVQYGLTHVNANRAIVILLFELVVAAIASWLLAGEEMTGKEWLGGALIVIASLFSEQLGEKQKTAISGTTT